MTNVLSYNQLNMTIEASWKRKKIKGKNPESNKKNPDSKAVSELSIHLLALGGVINLRWDANGETEKTILLK